MPARRELSSSHSHFKKNRTPTYLRLNPFATHSLAEQPAISRTVFKTPDFIHEMHHRLCFQLRSFFQLCGLADIWSLRDGARIVHPI